MYILPKTIHSFNDVLKCQEQSYQIWEKFSFWNMGDHPHKVSTIILNNKSKAGNIIKLELKTYLQPSKTQAIWYWHKNRHADQWNTLEIFEK